MIGPILLPVPFSAPYARLIMPPLLISLHLSLNLTMIIGLFPCICMVTWMLCLPPSQWAFVKESWLKGFAKFSVLTQLLPEPYTWQPGRWVRWPLGIALAFCLYGITAWNIGTLPDKSQPRWIRSYVLPLR